MEGLAPALRAAVGLPLTERDAAGVGAPVGVPLLVLMRVGVP
jgi:hypothetical protein